MNTARGNGTSRHYLANLFVWNQTRPSLNLCYYKENVSCWNLFCKYKNNSKINFLTIYLPKHSSCLLQLFFTIIIIIIWHSFIYSQEQKDNDAATEDSNCKDDTELKDKRYFNGKREIWTPFYNNEVSPHSSHVTRKGLTSYVFHLLFYIITASYDRLKKWMEGI